MERRLMKDGINYNCYLLDEAINKFGLEAVPTSRDKYYCVNVRGCNGSGKTSIATSMIKKSGDAVILLWEYTTKTNRKIIKPFATYLPSLKTVLLGTYFCKTGGLDGFSNNADTKRAIKMLWELGVTIYMEGVISSTILSTWGQWFNEFQNEGKIARKAVIVSLVPPFETCLARIQERNGGKEIKESQVKSKWDTVKRNAVKFRDSYDLISVTYDNSEVAKEDIYGSFENVLIQAIDAN